MVEIYHRRHRLHRRLFRAATSVFVLSLTGVIICVQSYAAGTMVASLQVGITQEITTTEPVAVIGGARPLLPAPIPEADIVSQAPGGAPPFVYKVHMIADGSIVLGSELTENLMQGVVPRIVDQRPLFQGMVAIPNAVIFLELHSLPEQAITARFQADALGRWEWRPPYDLSIEEHVLYLTIFDSTGMQKLGSAALRFSIVPLVPSEAVPVSPDAAIPDQSRTDLVIPQSLLEQRKPLFDIKTDIIGEDPDELRAGDTIYARISLLNIGAPSIIAKSNVRYRIIDARTNRTIYEETEQIDVSTLASYLKTFTLSESVPEGDYYLEAVVEHDNVEAYSHDDFQVINETMAPVIASADVDISDIMQLLVLMCIGALGLMYFEYHAAESSSRLIRQITERDLEQQGMLS